MAPGETPGKLPEAANNLVQHRKEAKISADELGAVANSGESTNI